MDLRGAFDRLAAITRQVLCLDPASGALFLFLNRKRNRLKALWWDRNGYTILYNHLSSHYTSFAFRRGRWFRLRDARAAAARLLRRSQRLQCFVG
ncbi:uncharacterized protein SOCE26_002090 [Sorangium cellulosum]|uniref:Transposase n=1 Tax=Sorangium cellulosum TaxID=56 RepID=A0A2L0EHR8_SORCE|nr:uncharacterized protein SOCE26_002090 [Sorangium cellulosum]